MIEVEGIKPITTSPETSQQSPMLAAPAEDGVLSDKDRIKRIVRADIHLRSSRETTVFAMKPVMERTETEVIFNAIKDGILPKSKDVRRQQLDILRQTTDYWKTSESQDKG